MSQGIRLLQHELRGVKQQNTKLNASVLELQKQLAAAEAAVQALEERLQKLEQTAAPIDIQQPRGATLSKRRGRKKKETPVKDVSDLPEATEG
jgi:CII-binding regulator of phage lambda lysogenization HflD